MTNRLGFTERSSGGRQDARFRLKIDPGGEGGIPSELTLRQNYPNPFRESTTIRYGLPLESQVRLDVYDVLGRRVQTLVNKRRQAGYHEIRWDPRSLASGVYFYRIATPDGWVNRQMTLIK